MSPSICQIAHPAMTCSIHQLMKAQASAGADYSRGDSERLHVLLLLCL